MSIEVRDVTGPVRYEKVSLNLGEQSLVLHFFSDDHERTNQCSDPNSVNFTKLLKQTLHKYPNTDVIFEGYDRQKKILMGNYLREFRSAFPIECWEQHKCDAFPFSTFHSVDIRAEINAKWMTKVSLIKEVLQTNDVHLRLPQVMRYLIAQLRRPSSNEDAVLMGWMFSIIVSSGRLAIQFVQLAEDWVQ